MKPRALFIGRWLTWHSGHDWLVRQKLDKGIPCLILVRETNEVPLAMSRATEIRKFYEAEDVIVQLIPDIESVNYGRGVGYEVNEYFPPEEIKSISGTAIRERK